MQRKKISSIRYSLEYVGYENSLKNGGYRPFIYYLRSFITNNNRIRLNNEVNFVKQDRKLLIQINSLEEQHIKRIICDHII